MIRWAALSLLVVGLVSFGYVEGQGKFNKKIAVGDAGYAWKDLPGTDGKKHSLADIKTDVVVLAVTCNKCPMAIAYEDRMIEFAKKYKGKATMVAINVNHAEADSMPKMIERAQEKGFPFSYLFDESQAVGREYGARVTPEFYVLDKNRKVVYMGALDDDPRQPKTNYLEGAVDAALSGSAPAVTETRAVGCGVAYKK